MKPLFLRLTLLMAMFVSVPVAVFALVAATVRGMTRTRLLRVL